MSPRLSLVKRFVEKLARSRDATHQFALQVCSLAIVLGGWEEEKTEARDEQSALPPSLYAV